MKLAFVFLLPCLAFGELAQAQTPIGPFPFQFVETFDAPQVPGASPGFNGFIPPGGGAPIATFNPLTPGGILMKSQNVVTLPPQRGLTCLFGRDTDVQIVFADPLRKFGGFFSRTNVAVGTTACQISFFLTAGGTSVPVGVPITVTLPPTAGPGTAAWIFSGFDLSSVGVGFFNEVRIVGIGGVFSGFVGMDSLTVAQ